MNLETAYFCCGARAFAPSGGEPLEAAFMDGVTWEYGNEKSACRSVVARHRIIDEFISAQLAIAPETRVVILGAGFDTRAFRTNGGHWTELDSAKVLEIKEEKLPAGECVGSLERRTVNFDEGTLDATLAEIHGNDPALVIVEGVWMYLGETEIKETLGLLRKRFPGHLLVCDLMTRSFQKTHSKTLGERFAKAGMPFRCVDRPMEIFKRCGYRQQCMKAIPPEGIGKVAGWLARWLVPSLKGYSVCVFK